jgi:hypothetical protein
MTLYQSILADARQPLLPGGNSARGGTPPSPRGLGGFRGEAEYIDREREGRRNLYGVKTHLLLGLPQRDIDLGSLLAILAVQDEPDAAS